MNEQNELILKANQLQNVLRIKLKIVEDENLDGVWLATYYFIEQDEKTNFIIIAVNTNTNTYKCKQN